jgi:hypothetical protein
MELPHIDTEHLLSLYREAAQASAKAAGESRGASAMAVAESAIDAAIQAHAAQLRTLFENEEATIHISMVRSTGTGH